jgi:adenosylcobinamide-phosphate synthase
MMSDFILVMIAAVILDFILGDPRWLPHPIRWMGWAIETMEPRFRRFPLPLVFSGALNTVFLIGVTYGATFCLVALCEAASPLFGKIISIILIFYCISIRSLSQSAQDVLKELVSGDLRSARACVGKIVGRDSQGLSKDGIRRAVVETVAENFVDGVAAPLFYAVIGGAPLAMAYKMVNTLDSMIGYKNIRYHQFGKVAARIDDAVNFLPARLAVPAIALAANLLGRSGRRAFRTALVEGANHSSPNAGYPEAAFAGALAVRLNGPNDYGGVLVDKPFIGIKFGRVRNIHISKACDLMWLSSMIWAGMLIVADLIVGGIF